MNICLTSSNIRFDNPEDGVNAWGQRKTILSQSLLANSPDIIATQEGRIDQLKELEKILRDYEIVDTHRSWMGSRMYPSFFIKKNFFEIISSMDLWLSDTPELAGSSSFGSAFPRLMTVLKVQLKNTSEKLFLINTHLDHKKSNTRIQQVQVLINQVQRVMGLNEHLVIMGDFNDSPQSQVRSLLMDAFPQLQDSWRKFNSKEESSHHPFSGHCEEGNRIDWILTDNKLHLNECFLDKSHCQGKYPSDHFPVVCKFKVVVN